MTPPMEDVCARARVEPWMAEWRACWHTGWRWWLWRMVAPGLVRRISAWPPMVRLEAGLREMVTMPNLLEEDPLHEITLYVDRHNHIHVHHPKATNSEQLILVANVLLKASQIVAAQAGAQVVSQPLQKANKESRT